MGQDSQDTFTTWMQNILHIAHGLREATAAFGSINQSSPPKTCHSPVVIDSINLPSPRPLLPSLLEAGINFEIASAASQIYSRRAEQLKQCIQESITTACRKAAEFPAFTSTLPPELLMEKVTSAFTEVYVRRLEEWKEESTQRIKQASKEPVEVALSNPRTFNHDYVPSLEHFFQECPFPTHADKAFLAKKSNMRYRQIHVWFQNRRNRTKKEGKTLRKKPIYEGTTKSLDKVYERMKSRIVESGSQVPRTFKVKGPTEMEIARENMSKDTFASSSPPHAFPSSYPPTCHYDPFPCKSGPVHFRKPEWRRASCGKPPLPLSTSIDELVERFSQLNVRDDARSKGSPKLHSHAATVAITVIPSRAPHPSLIVRKYRQPTNIVERHPLVRAPISIPKVFQSSDLTSKPVTLIPPSISLNKGGLPGKRKTAPLPRRLPGRVRNTCRDTTPSEDSESRSSSVLSVSSLSTPPDMECTQKLPCSFGSCRSPFDSPMYLRNLGDMTTIIPSSVS